MPRLVDQKLVVATHNAGKLREMRELLAPYGIDALSAADLGLGEPDETGMTFSANAILKAEAATRATGLPAFADDSGLCIEALDGGPGLVSARYAQEAGGFAQAMARLRRDLDDRRAAPPYRAFFISALALAHPGEPPLAVEGRIDGALVFPPRGMLGFGYDPVFLPDNHDRTFGEMDAVEKHGIPADGSRALSHRARAFQIFAKACLIA